MLKGLGKICTNPFEESLIVGSMSYIYLVTTALFFIRAVGQLEPFPVDFEPGERPTTDCSPANHSSGFNAMVIVNDVECQSIFRF